jgi:hypothetical protein
MRRSSGTQAATRDQHGTQTGKIDEYLNKGICT